MCSGRAYTQNWKEAKEVPSQVFTGNSMCSMVESMKTCIAVPDRNMRETGAGSRLKTQGNDLVMDNEQTWVMVQSSQSEDKWLMSDTAEKMNAWRKQTLAKQ